VSSFIPCPPELLPYCAASWKINDRIGAALAPVAKSISGSGDLENVNTVQLRHQKDGRTFVGPAGLFDEDAGESLRSTDTDLLPIASTNYTLVGVIWRLNGSAVGDGSSTLYHAFGIERGTALATWFGYTQIASNSYAPTLRTVILGQSAQATAISDFDEPIVCVLSANAATPQTIVRYIELYSGVTLVTHTVGGVHVTDSTDRLIFGRPRTASLPGSTIAIQDCWTVLQGYAATADDAMAFRDHLYAQREMIETYIKWSGA